MGAEGRGGPEGSWGAVHRWGCGGQDPMPCMKELVSEDVGFLHALTARKFGASSAAWLSGCLYRYALHHSGGAMFPSE